MTRRVPEAIRVCAAADQVERLAPLDPQYREVVVGNRFFTLMEVCEAMRVPRDKVVAELVRRRERAAAPEAK